MELQFKLYCHQGMGRPRDSFECVGNWSSLTSTYLKKHLAKAEAHFANHKIQWFMLVQHQLDFEKGTTESKVLAHKIHPEAPIVEFNLAAKGKIPVVKKKMLGDYEAQWGWLAPVQPVQELNANNLQAALDEINQVFAQPAQAPQE